VRDNPFTYGNPITDPRRFFGRRREVDQVFGRLRNAEFESISVVGERRIGKTSLLKHVADPNIRQKHGLGPERHIFVFFNLQMVEQTMGPAQLWRYLLRKILQQSASDELTTILAAILADLERSGQLNLVELEEFFQQVDDMGQHVVFLLDEFDHVTTNENFGPDFYSGLRGLAIQHQVAFVTSSRMELIELCQSEPAKSSALFNIFQQVNLGLFSVADRQHMISRSLSNTGVHFSDPELEQVYDLAGLHPFFLKVACSFLYGCHVKRLDETQRLDSLAKEFRAAAAPHFMNYWKKSSDYEKIVLTAATLTEQKNHPVRDLSVADMRQVYSGSESCVGRLENRGLLMSCPAGYRLFSSALGPWILEQITAESGEELSYHEWLAENRAAVERVTGRQGAPLRQILPKIGIHYRDLILTWANDPRTLPAMVNLLKNFLPIMN
jgi:AAA ATPase domain